MATSPGMLQSILQGVGAPVTANTLRDLQAWQRAEGGSATYNPFNTTQGGYGGSNYNGVGVKNYGSPAIGVKATVATLNNGYYKNILKSLRTGGNASEFSGALGASPWGTSGSLVANILKTTPTSLNTGSTTIAQPKVSAPTVGAVGQRQALSTFLLKNSQSLLSGGFGESPTELANALRGLSNGRTTGSEPVSGGSTPSPAATVSPDTMKPAGGWVNVSPTANRAGVPLHPATVDFVGAVAREYGKPLTIGTGTNHNQYVVDTNRQSAHWTGDAADIPATGDQLTTMGQDALIAAGMPEAEARKQTGGLFNIGGYQVIFNSHIGGNHYNHLHVGLRRG